MPTTFALPTKVNVDMDIDLETEKEDTVPELPKPNSGRRKSVAIIDDQGKATPLSAKILDKWEEMQKRLPTPEPTTEGELRSQSQGPRVAVPRRLSIAEMQEILYDCIENPPNLPESRRASIDASQKRKDSIGYGRRNSIDEVSHSAIVLTGIMNEIVDKVHCGEAEEYSSNKRMGEEDVARALDENLPLEAAKLLEDQFDLSIIYPIEMSLDDVNDTWTGMLDTNVPPKTCKTAIEVKEKPIGHLVSEAITDLSSTLSEVENLFITNLASMPTEGNLGCTVEELKSDVSDFIKTLQSKLDEKSDVCMEEGDRELTAKAALIYAEQERMEQLREEQDRLRLEHEEQKRQEELQRQKEAEMQKAEEERQEKIRLMEETAKKQEMEQPVIVEEAKTEEDFHEMKRKKMEEKRAERRQQKIEEKQIEDSKNDRKMSKKKKESKKGGDSLLRRRKTSTNRKLSKLKTDGVADNLPEATPAPNVKISEEDFLAAAQAGKSKAVIKYINDGGNINMQDDYKRTALQRAALYGEMEVIEALIKKKAKMNLSDKLGDTALHWACRGGNTEAVKVLVKNGAKINAKDKLFSTPLHVAVRCGVQEVVDALIHLGADINAKDREGDTPMHDAVRLGRFKLVKTLLSAGSNLRAKNMNGQTPIDMVTLWYQETKSHHADIIMQTLTKPGV